MLRPACELLLGRELGAERDTAAQDEVRIEVLLRRAELQEVFAGVHFAFALVSTFHVVYLCSDGAGETKSGKEGRYVRICAANGQISWLSGLNLNLLLRMGSAASSGSSTSGVMRSGAPDFQRPTRRAPRMSAGEGASGKSSSMEAAESVRNLEWWMLGEVKGGKRGEDALVELGNELGQLAEGEEATVFGPGGAVGMRGYVVAAAEEGDAGGGLVYTTFRCSRGSGERGYS